MEVTSLIMVDYEGEYWEIFLLPVSLNLGSLIGCFSQSFYVGKLGRAPVFQFSAMVSTVGGLFLCCFHYSFMFHLGLCIIGYSVGGDMVIAYTILMESIPQSKSNSLTLLSVGWSFGVSLSVFGAFLIEVIIQSEISAWKYLLWVGTVTSALLAYFRGFILESPMYLYDRGDLRLESTLQKMAELNSNDYSTCIDEADEGKIEKDENFYIMTIFLSIEYLLTNFPYSTLFYFMPQLLAVNELHVQYAVIFFQQLSGIPGILSASYWIKPRESSITIRSLCFCSSGLLILALSMDLDIWATSFISCLINLTMMTGLSLLYTYSQETYSTETRGYMNGFLSGIGLITGVFGSIIIGHVQQNYGSFATLWLLAFSFLLSSLCPLILHKLIK